MLALDQDKFHQLLTTDNILSSQNGFFQFSQSSVSYHASEVAQSMSRPIWEKQGIRH